MSDTEQPVSQFKSKSGLRRVFAAFFYSLDGFRAAWRHEHAFRQELMIAVPGIIVALLLPVSRLEKLVLIASLVLTAATVVAQWKIFDASKAQRTPTATV